MNERYKTGFVTQHGHWQWKCLPFELKISLAIFQRIQLGIIGQDELHTFYINYTDIILIY